MASSHRSGFDRGHDNRRCLRHGPWPKDALLESRRAWATLVLWLTLILLLPDLSLGQARGRILEQVNNFLGFGVQTTSPYRVDLPIFKGGLMSDFPDCTEKGRSAESWVRIPTRPTDLLTYSSLNSLNSGCWVQRTLP